MKCVLSNEFKELCSSVLYTAIFVAMLTAAFIALSTAIGYTSLHWFDLALEIPVVEGPFEYYLKQGIILIVITIVLILLLTMFYSLVLYPLYYLIFNFKKILNFIFDCKETK